MRSLLRRKRRQHGKRVLIRSSGMVTSNTDHHARMSPVYQSDRSSSPLSSFARAVPPFFMSLSHLSRLSGLWSSSVVVLHTCGLPYLRHTSTLPTLLIYNTTYTAYRPTPPLLFMLYIPAVVYLPLSLAPHIPHSHSPHLPPRSFTRSLLCYIVVYLYVKSL